MLNKRLIAMTGATLSCVMGIGFFMQKGAVAPAQPDPVLQQAAAVQVPAEPDMIIQGITLTSALPVDATGPAARNEVAAKSVSCDISAVAVPGPMATVDLTVSAPCNRNERLTVHHYGMMFTATTDDAGALQVQVPALSDLAVMIVEFPSGQGAVASTPVTGLDQIDRVAVQWSGTSGFEIHAREFGAEYGQPGHIWTGAENDSSTSAVVRLGDADQLAPRMVEIYSFASADDSRSGTIDLSVEAEVTALNCGREISAQSLELTRTTGLRTRDLVLSIPNCDAIGDFLVLNNLVENLKIAAK